ncbi:MAG: aminopeptidase, partial [Acidimicrobiia bacterium]|nr:aminopeptidase [Acidimicrobiia bacterium]
SNRIYVATEPCEPQLGRRGLYPTLGGGRVAASVDDLLNVLTYCDGKDDIVAVSEYCGLSIAETERVIRILQEHDLVRELDARD